MLKSAHYLISDKRKKFAQICARARLNLHALPSMGREFGCAPARARPS